MDQHQHQQKDYVHITSDKLSFEELSNKVSDNSAGAIATFSGTTRDNFNGKKVVQLEYEAYIPMAEKEMRQICERMRQKWNLVKIALSHRIGEVPVGEVSVIVAASSAHRKDALDAVQFGIDEIKTWVPIWKKEVYEDGSVWKDNCEGCHHHNASNNSSKTTKNSDHVHTKA